MSSCARQCKLFRVSFPPVTNLDAPAWLPWSDEEWLVHRHAWCAQVDKVLDIETYLRQFFQVPERLAAAERELLASL